MRVYISHICIHILYQNSGLTAFYRFYRMYLTQNVFLNSIFLSIYIPFINITGSTLSATDPVAVVTLMEPSGAPHKLTMIMGGESHMGDLTMLILFEVFLNLSLEIEYTPSGLGRLREEFC